MESIHQLAPTVPQTINPDQSSSCFINLLVVIILALIAYILITSSSKRTENEDDDNEDDDGNELFTDRQCGTYSNNFDNTTNNISKCD